MENSLVPTMDPNKFVENVKRWVILDTHLKMINEKTKKIRDERHELTANICEYLEKNNMTHKKIGINDGKTLSFHEKKEYSPLTFGYIEECLGKLIQEKEQVAYIIQFLKENRVVKVSPDLHLKTSHGGKSES